VFGGATKAGQTTTTTTTKQKEDRTIYSHEMYFYDCEQFRWMQVSPGHAYPNPRFGHSMTVVTGWKTPPRFHADGTVVVASGEAGWDEHETTCQVFSFVFGGINSMYCNSDTWMLEMQWRSRKGGAITSGDQIATTDEAHLSPEGNGNALEDSTPQHHQHFHSSRWLQDSLRRLRKENALCAKELVREEQLRTALQKRYMDLEHYCTSLQSQLKDVQVES